MKLLAFFTAANALSRDDPNSPSLAAGPGAGQTPLTPDAKAAEVRKDGFFALKCVNDGSHVHADNQSSQGKMRYAAQNADISIIWYHETVPKVDQEEMTPRTCFNFCRIQKRIGFFGLIHGRDCYCTPYYRQQEGGEGEDCDLPCPGDQTTLCGGKTKANLYTMHWCDDTTKDLELAKNAASTVSALLGEMIEKYKVCQGSLQGRGEEFQAKASAAGSLFASNYFQAAKVRAGELKRLFEKAQRLQDEEIELASGPPDAFTAIKKQEYLEGQVFNLEEFEQRASEFLDTAKLEFVKTCDHISEKDYEVSHEYRPIIYYAKDQGIVPESYYEFTACGGEMIGSPLFMGLKSCALACRDHVKCEAFSVFGVAGEKSDSDVPSKYPTLIQKSARRFMARQFPSGSPPSDSCVGKCGGPAGMCWCDSLCQGYGDCCQDFNPICSDNSGICVLLSSAKKASIFSSKECEGYKKMEVLTECYYRLSDSKGLDTKYDIETQWCKA